MRTEVI
jgi:hypothetical protein